MFEIVAIDPANGWFFVRDGQRIRLFRPPYREEQARPASDAMVEQAVTRYDFSGRSQRTRTLADAVKFAREEVLRWRTLHGPPGGALSGVGQLVMKTASVPAIERVLRRIEGELVGARLYDDAEEILSVIEASSVHLPGNAELAQKIHALRLRVRHERESRVARVVPDESRFPRLAKCNGLEGAQHRARRIRISGSLFVG